MTYEEITVFPIGITDPSSVSLENCTKNNTKIRKYIQPKVASLGMNGVGTSLPTINTISPVETTTTNTRTHREVELLHLELIACL
jgi:hypothetical protein